MGTCGLSDFPTFLGMTSQETPLSPPPAGLVSPHPICVCGSGKLVLSELGIQPHRRVSWVGLGWLWARLLPLCWEGGQPRSRGSVALLAPSSQPHSWDLGGVGLKAPLWAPVPPSLLQAQLLRITLLHFLLLRVILLLSPSFWSGLKDPHGSGSGGGRSRLSNTGGVPAGGGFSW